MLKRGFRTFSGCVVALSAAACTEQVRDMHAVQFGPPSARSEIVKFFGIGSGQPALGDLLSYADRRGIHHEQLEYDKSLIYCRVDEHTRATLDFTMFNGGVVASEAASLHYVVASLPGGQVVCIETRHAYRAL